ncbi:MAG: hypothetical protein ACREOR_09980 [Candidatus Binatia bacterium]
MVNQLTLENLRVMAERAGLRLSDDELERLLPGVNRARQQVAELREIIERADEPAGAFDAANAERK